MAGFSSKLGLGRLGQFKLGDVEPGVVTVEDVLDNSRTGTPSVAEAISETLSDSRTGSPTLTLERITETISDSRTGVPSLSEIYGLVDTLQTTATNVPSLIDEQILVGYVADTLTNERTDVSYLLNDGYVDELENTRTDVSRIDDLAPETFRSTRTSQPSLVEIVDIPGPDTLDAVATNVPSMSEIVDSTEDTLTAIATNVPSISDRFINNVLYPTGPGTGGEIAALRLAPSGVEVAVQLTADVSASASTLSVTSTADLPDEGGFIVFLDGEEIFVGAVNPNELVGCRRGMGNTRPVVHVAGVSARWTDTYNMTIVSAVSIAPTATAPTTLDPLYGTTFHCFVVALDCTQGYNEDGDRYATHVRSCVGIFPPREGNSDLSLSKTDGPQPSSISAVDGLSDRVPVGLTVPARLRDTVDAGDVMVLRYKNVEDYVVILGPRCALGQTWYGVIRVSDLNANVTLTDPNGHSTDGTASQTYPDSDPVIAVTMPASSRHFTRSAVGDPGVLMSGLVVRNGNRRVPLWTSPNWHDFSWIFNGFGTDRNFIQCVARRKNVDLPSDSALTGPNATWDDPTYETSVAWHVVLVGYTADAVIAGPPLNGNPPPNPPPEVIFVGGGGSTGGGGGFSPWEPPVDPDEGGAGGNIDQGSPTPGVFLEITFDRNANALPG